VRSLHLFSDGWLYAAEKLGQDAPDSAFEAVTLPHSNRLLPHQGFDDASYQFISTYRKSFTLPEPINGRRVYLDFEGAMIASTVTLNGHTFDEYRGGYTPFSFDITDIVNESGDNQLTVHLDSSERADIPPFGYVVDYLTFGGIYRDVHLRYVEPQHITNVRTHTADPLGDTPQISADVHLLNQSDTEQTVQINAVLPINDEQSESLTQSLTVPAGEAAVVTLKFPPLANLRRWSPDDPHRYEMTVSIEADATVLDTQAVKFGIREAVFRDDGFYLNGEKFFLRGLNRHQTFPYFGAAAPARLQRKDADIVRFELGCNVVRTSHYPQSKHFIERCDEIGLLVFEEIPGWQHIGDEDWQDLSVRDVRAMIERDWNHPCIILWGVRINESEDNSAFYTRTNTLARELDPTRQTGGVRYFQDSEFLEDVFTFNDFSNSIVEPSNTPHLVTEFNGHMFPTKTFDNEERRVEHALRHARIQDRALGMGGVSGAIGWCAFDYNTHKEFGSGDRICYHGVMDMFRLPKYAAYAYLSQVSPDEQIVLMPATLWSMGDRSEGGNDPLYIFSNCEQLRVIAGNEDLGLFEPARAEFPYLPHAPFKVEGMRMRWGEQFGDLQVIGYIKGEQVAEQWVAVDGQPEQLQLSVDDAALDADGRDMTRVVVRLVDRYHNPLPYLATVVSFDIEGPGELIGTNPFPLIGGQCALWLKAGKEAGTVTIKARAAGLAEQQVQVEMKG